MNGHVFLSFMWELLLLQTYHLLRGMSCFPGLTPSYVIGNRKFDSSVYPYMCICIQRI